MAKMVGVFTCLFIMTLDIIAGILGIKAEAVQNQQKHVRLWLFECKDPSQEAYRLALAAATLLGVAHVLANLLGGCNVCTRDEIEKATPNRQLSFACLFFTWIILAIGFSMLVTGIISNKKSRASCGFTHNHFLSIGGILCFVHGFFSVTYYITATAAHSLTH
ncbi:hypothetical protein LguiA_035240 [Lonicera macranthoides]